MQQLQHTLAGRYDLLDGLGQGGMGVVYRARDGVLGRTVAVKVLPADRAEDPVSVARFQREARAAAALNHPNIVAVFDSGRDEDTHFIVMELVPGLSLAQIVRRRGPLPADEAVEIATKIADALAAAHGAGIVHRDIKPANVMVADEGVVKVLDFGIARAVSATSLTQTAIVLGSAPYLSPEVTRGETADERSDVYSLGCVLYEMLVGRPPFSGEVGAAVMHQHNAAEPEPPRARSRSTPRALDALVLRMLAKRPQDRPQHARDLIPALQASLADRTTATAVRPHRPTAMHPYLAAAMTAPTQILARRRPLGERERTALAVGVMVLLVLLAFLAFGSSGSGSHGTSAATGTRTTGKPATTSTPAGTRTTATSSTAASPPPASQPGPPSGHGGHGHGQGQGDQGGGGGD